MITVTIAQWTITFPLLLIFVVGAVLILLFLAGLPWVARRTDFLAITRDHLRRFAPLYFVVGPSAITYFAACGTLSIIGTLIFTYGHDKLTRAEIIQHGIFTMYRWIEYTCSFLGAYEFTWLIRRVGLSWVWVAISVMSLSVNAAYRTARNDPGPVFHSGPHLLLSPQLLDVIPVILGLMLFVFQQERLNKTRLAAPAGSNIMYTLK